MKICYKTQIGSGHLRLYCSSKGLRMMDIKYTRVYTVHTCAESIDVKTRMSRAVHVQF